MFKKGFKDSKKLNIGDRLLLIKRIHKSKDISEVKENIKQYISFPDFSSFVEEYEYLIGFLSGISYLTKKDIEQELLKLADILNVKNIPDISSYYIAANRYFDKGYGKERVVVALRPKKGTLAKGKTRVPKIKDFNELKKIVENFKDLLNLYQNIEKRRYYFFSKVS